MASRQKVKKSERCFVGSQLCDDLDACLRVSRFKFVQEIAVVATKTFPARLDVGFPRKRRQAYCPGADFCC